MRLIIISTLILIGSLQAYNVKNNDTVIDSATSYEWQDNETSNSDWHGAMQECTQLVLGGKSDWRLPSYEELQSIVDTDYLLMSPSQGAISLVFENVVDNTYWSATTYAPGTTKNLAVTFNSGELIIADRSEGFAMRCVRGSFVPMAASEVFIENILMNINNQRLSENIFNQWYTLMQDESLARVVIEFFNSPDFIQMQLSGSEYITFLYENTLERKPTSDEKETLLARLDSGVSQETVMYELLNSAEFKDIADKLGVRAIREEDQATRKGYKSIPSIIFFILS